MNFPLQLKTKYLLPVSPNKKALSSTGKALPEMPSPGILSWEKYLVLTHRYVEAMGGNYLLKAIPAKGILHRPLSFSKPS
ncbi:MAG: hypothetical protein H6559_08490 [Lewinellaceae bacterium]|nr:hypothetical protein [Lewinellaceae bacterium]